MKILDREIGPTHRPYLIAELSGNHNGSLEHALEIIDAAAECGADAVKLQTYTADTMTLDVRMPGFIIEDPDSLWAGRQLYELYEEAHTPWEWHQPLMERARSHGLHCFSTPFDQSAVNFLENLDVPCYKIASFEIIDLPLVRAVAATGKPLILSTGMASVGEIDEAVTAAREAGCRDLILLKCTSNYPANAKNANIATIPHMRKMFRCEVGLSDHTDGCGVAVTATALGATVIEKHFTLRRSDGGVDSAFSLEPHELKQLREETDRAWNAVGQVSYGPTEDEKPSLGFRRSLYVARDMKAGDILTEADLRSVRPGFGLPPKFYEQVLGRRVGQNVTAGTPLSWSMIL